MAIQNKTITLLGATAKVVSFTVYPQPDGTWAVTISGTATDGAVFVQQMTAARSYAAGVAILVNMAAGALLELRTQNGLES
jgi:hypothetical protein